MLTPPQLAHSRELSSERLAAIYRLQTSIWPPRPPAPPFEQRLEEFKARLHALGTIHATIWDDSQLAAHGRFHRHEIRTAAGPLEVGCLAAVCVEPEYRGRGLGRDVVRALFDFIDAGSPPVMLFQTGVPEFYDLLGARLVTNRFVDGTNQADPEANPWHEQHLMIYPASFDWPDGVVDIRGREW